MKNWSTDTSRLKKNKKKFTVWKLEQLINFGLGKEKIDKHLLRKHWDSIDIDSTKRKFLSYILK